MDGSAQLMRAVAGGLRLTHRLHAQATRVNHSLPWTFYFDAVDDASYQEERERERLGEMRKEKKNQPTLC